MKVKLAKPDNAKYSTATRTLFIGEDGTGLQVVDTAMQHVGDWSCNATQSAAGGLKEKVAANWGGLMKQSANGYIALPVLK